MAKAFDLGSMVGSVRERLALLMSADKTAAEMVEILRDTHRILQKLESAVDRLDETVQSVTSKLGGIDLSPERIARLEEAILNIERATGGVEGAINALPRAVRERIWPQR